MRTTTGHIGAIQILRGFAAMMVVLHHFMAVTRPYSHAGSLLQFHYLADVGACGVDIFFCISGFVMMLLVSRQQCAKGFRPLDFMARRAIRILPMYWILTTALVALILICNGLSDGFVTVFALPLQPRFLATSYLLLPSYIPGSKTIAPLLFQGWTLSYEFYFYIAVALSARLLKKTSHIALALTVEVAGSLLLSRVLPPSGLALQSFLSNTIVIEFLYGVVIFQLFNGARGDWRFARGCMLAGAVGLIVTMYLPALHSHRALLWGIPAALIVLGSVMTDGGADEANLLMRLGNASYSVYLVHLLLVYLYGALLVSGAVAGNISQYLAIAAACLATLVIGVAVHHWIEKPLTVRLAVAFGHAQQV